MPKDKLKLYTNLKSDLLHELKELEARASEIRSALSDGGQVLAPSRDGRHSSVGRRGRANRLGVYKRTGRAVTVNDAILSVLAKSGQADIATILSGVNDVKGKVSKATLGQALVVLKKKGAILNPSRGQYSLKK